MFLLTFHIAFQPKLGHLLVIFLKRGNLCLKNERKNVKKLKNVKKTLNNLKT